MISNLGFYNPTVPKLQLRDKETRSIIRFSTFTFFSFSWILDAFYPNGVKIVPSCIEHYFTPLALAIWIMDDGGQWVMG